MMSASITSIVVRKQLAAMGCDRFDIGVLLPNARMLLREGWSTDQIDAALQWLRRENARGAHIFIRPHALHGVNLIDDLASDTIARMKVSGFQPAVIVETSTAFQARTRSAQWCGVPRRWKDTRRRASTKLHATSWAASTAISWLARLPSCSSAIASRHFRLRANRHLRSAPRDGVRSLARRVRASSASPSWKDCNGS